MENNIDLVVEKIINKNKYKGGIIPITRELFIDLLNSGKTQYKELNRIPKEGRGFYHDLVYRDTKFRAYTPIEITEL